MKTFKLISLLMLMPILVSSCDWLFHHDPMPFSFALSFQDTSGKDLVKGIEYTPNSMNYNYTGLIEEKLYTLRAFDSEDPKPTRSSMLGYIEGSDNYSYLVFFGRGGLKSKLEITYLLTCPSVFGDDEEHEIVAYCKEKKNAYVCYRLTFDGEDIVPVEGILSWKQTSSTVVID